VSRGFIAAVLPLVLLTLPWSVAFGAPRAIDLGPLTNALPSNPHLPLGGFHHVGKALTRASRVEVLFVATQADNDSLAEQWPLIKTLQQYGTFSESPSPLHPVCQHGGPMNGTCPNPRFDLDHLRYSSKYVALVYRDLENQDQHCLPRLPRDELKLVRQAGIRYFPASRYPCQLLFNVVPTHLPLLLVGGYLQTQQSVAVRGDYQTFLPPATPDQVSTPATGLPFDTVQNALASGKDPKGLTLIEDVNAETNLISAFICHADRMRPSTLCHRSAIRQILKHVK
jgi:hypothetical protein